MCATSQTAFMDYGTVYRELQAHQVFLKCCQTIAKVGQLLWVWFSCQRKSADKIGRFSRLQLRVISASFVNTQQQNAYRKMILTFFFCICMN